MSIYVLLNPKNGENFVKDMDNISTRFCLEQQIVSFASERFTVESVSSGMNITNLSSSIKYRLRYLDNGQYLVNEFGTSCFTLTNNPSLASVWEDREGKNEVWYITTPTDDGSRTTAVTVSIIVAKECQTCGESETCNYYTGICGSCASCEGNCNGPCPSGYTCEVVGNEYTCVKKSKALTYLFIILGIFAFIAIIILIAFFASR